jgi:hypothetical protein
VSRSGRRSLRYCGRCADEGCGICEDWYAVAFHALATIGLCVAYGIACEVLVDAVTYVPNYFRDKHGHDEALVALGLPVPPKDEDRL